MEQQRKDPLAGMAYFISLIFHPLLMPTLFFLTISAFVSFLLAPWSNDGRFLILGIIFIFTFVFPLIICFLLFYAGESTVADFFSMDESRERVKPFLLVGCIYLLFSYVLHQQLRLNHIVIMVVSNMGLSILIAAIISYFWKISIHAIGAGGILGFLLTLNEWYADGALFYIIIATVPISGFILSARLYLNQHLPSQVYVGYLIGLVISIGGMFYLK